MDHAIATEGDAIIIDIEGGAKAERWTLLRALAAYAFVMLDAIEARVITADAPDDACGIELLCALGDDQALIEQIANWLKNKGVAERS